MRLDHFLFLPLRVWERGTTVCRVFSWFFDIVWDDRQGDETGLIAAFRLVGPQANHLANRHCVGRNALAAFLGVGRNALVAFLQAGSLQVSRWS